MVYLTKKLDKKPFILIFGHTNQIILNTSNLIGGFFKLTIRWSFWLVKLNNKMDNQKNLIKKTPNFKNYLWIKLIYLYHVNR